MLGKQKMQKNLFGVDLLSGEAASSTGDIGQATNYRLIGTRDLGTGWRQRASDNVEALRVSQDITRRGTRATSAECAKLIKFTGFGASALAQNMFRSPNGSLSKGWESMAALLESTVDDARLRGLAKATQYAHYTPEGIARAMWEAIGSMGFRGGTVIEPGCGAGMFLATVPASLASGCMFTAIDDDPSSVEICRHLYPESVIVQEDYCTSAKERACELVIGNPPYSDRHVSNRTPLGKLGLSLHDFFIARSMGGLKPGGLASFLTSRFTLDKQDDKLRRHLAADFDLVAAVRLPNGCMRLAGTEVMADVLLFRRRLDGEDRGDQSWLETQVVLPKEGDDDAIAVNRWFVERPRAVLGRHCRVKTQFGMRYGCTADGPGDLNRALQLQLNAAVNAYQKGSANGAAMRSRLQDQTTGPGQQEAMFDAFPQRSAGVKAAPVAVDRISTTPASKHWRNNSYLIHGGRLMQVSDGHASPVVARSKSTPDGMPTTHEKLIRLLIPVRDNVRAVLDAQKADRSWVAEQASLNIAYRTFLNATGKPINDTVIVERTDATTGATTEHARQPVIAAFKGDPDCWLVASIEHYDAQTNTATRGPIFTGRVLGPAALDPICDAVDALPLTLRDRGHVDMPYLAALANASEAAAIERLGSRIYLNPEDMCWETADAYLSGNVRSKLRAAETAMGADERFERNAVALKAALPTPLLPSQITAGLGSPWIPTDVIEEFCRKTFDVATMVRHNAAMAMWKLDQSPFKKNANCGTTWGTQRMHTGQLLDCALNSSVPNVYDTFHEDGRQKSVLNHVETEAARAKMEEIQRMFSRWIWQDCDKAVELLDAYNDKYNNLAPRVFDGSHLTLDDSNLTVRFYDKQKRAIWRNIASGSSYVAHYMGAGKTITLIATIMEQRRLGLVKKALLVCPNHVLNQFATEFLKLYPLARILVANEDDMSRKNRLQFMARATTEDWDCVIVSQSAFKFLPVPSAFEQGLLKEEREKYLSCIENADEDGSVFTRKQMERMKEKIDQKIDNLQTIKDDLVTIADIGIDQIIVDEAHEFRKLSFATNMRQIKGIDPDGSQRAWHLYIASRYTDSVNPGRGLILSSGTPVSNTLAELYTVQRLLGGEALEERGLHAFDAWASTFGRMKTELELQPNGSYKQVSRFCDFVNLPELTAMFRQFADIVLEEELKDYLVLPRLRGGGRQIVTCPATDGFKEGQKKLAVRIEKIAQRGGKPKPGDDILLSVINDGRLLAVDPRTLDPGVGNDGETKLNRLVKEAHRIYRDNLDRSYVDPATGQTMPATGSAQMIFSDIAILPAARRGGFSAYEWIRSELIRLGVPASKIAFMQDHKKAEARRKVFNAVNNGSILFLLGSTQTMGTGANAQLRLVAMHHLDQPYLVSSISQRECRMVRQGNQNQEVELLAYVTEGSMDATMWQLLKRKATFINAIMKGDPGLRQVSEEDDEITSFAYARAMASGDTRLLEKAGIEADIGRLDRLQSAHWSNQFSIRRKMMGLNEEREELATRIEGAKVDLTVRQNTAGTAFKMTVGRSEFTERTKASEALRKTIDAALRNEHRGKWKMATIAGFDVVAEGWEYSGGKKHREYLIDVFLQRTSERHRLEVGDAGSGHGCVIRIENLVNRIEEQMRDREERLNLVERQLVDYEASSRAPFEFEDDLNNLRERNTKLELEMGGAKPKHGQEVPIEDGKGQSVPNADGQANQNIPGTEVPAIAA